MVVHQSPCPASVVGIKKTLKDIADRTGQDYERVRKTVHRMLRAGELASPARGEFTTPGHPWMTKHINDNHDVPTETTETSVPK